MSKPLIWYYRRGIIIGALAGLGFAFYLIQKDYTSIAQILQASKGFLDSLMARSSPATIELTKIYLVFATIGASIGWLSEYLLINVFKIYGGR